MSSPCSKKAPIFGGEPRDRICGGLPSAHLSRSRQPLELLPDSQAFERNRYFDFGLNQLGNQELAYGLPSKAGVGQFAGAKGMQACPTLQPVLDQSFLNTRVQSYAIK